jgi:flagellar protein FlaG
MRDRPRAPLEPLLAVAPVDGISAGGAPLEGYAPATAPVAGRAAAAPPGAAQPVDAAALGAALEKINARLLADGQDLRLSVDASTHQSVIVVRDHVTGAVIRQIPSEDALRLAAALETGSHGIIDLTA